MTTASLPSRTPSFSSTGGKPDPFGLKLWKADRFDRSFYFYGSVVYWLNMLDDAELDTTFSRIRDLGITVVRTWAFNDVSQKPAAGNYFQVCAWVVPFFKL
jgi:hypothetical protein